MSLEQQFLEEFGTITFSDETPAERGLGWFPAEDERDYKAEDYLTAEITSGKAFWANPIQLDQGTELLRHFCPGRGQGSCRAWTYRRVRLHAGRRDARPLPLEQWTRSHRCELARRHGPGG